MAHTAAADWPALAAATACDARSRVPLWVQGDPGEGAGAAVGASADTPLDAPVDAPIDAPLDPPPRLAGSVARAHLPLLARWPSAVQLHSRGVLLALPAADRTAFLAEANHTLRQAGAIVAWRDETYGLLALPPDRSAPEPQRDLLATMERAAARFWGSATFGAHCNGYVADAQGRPTHLWIARRSLSKATDPGLLDNLVGGGVPHGQQPGETVVREAWEEAGLTPAQMHHLQPGRILCLARDLPEGFQLEWLSVYDLALPTGLQPVNQDGEVHSLHCLPVAQALAHAAAGDMTVDASLATLDFALRHRLLPAPHAPALETALRRLVCGPARLASTTPGRAGIQ